MNAVKRADDVVFEVTGGRAVLLDGAGQELISLNPVGTLVWQAIDGQRDTASLAQELQTTFAEVAVAELAADIDDFVGELRALGLVVDASG